MHRMGDVGILNNCASRLVRQIPLAEDTRFIVEPAVSRWMAWKRWIGMALVCTMGKLEVITARCTIIAKQVQSPRQNEREKGKHFAYYKNSHKLLTSPKGDSH